MVFEYRTITGKRVTINPKMITLIVEEDKTECKVYTVDGDGAIHLKESYDRLKEDFNNAMYSGQSLITL